MGIWWAESRVYIPPRRWSVHACNFTFARIDHLQVIGHVAIPGCSWCGWGGEDGHVAPSAGLLRVTRTHLSRAAPRSVMTEALDRAVSDDIGSVEGKDELPI